MYLSKLQTGLTLLLFMLLLVGSVSALSDGDPIVTRDPSHHVPDISAPQIARLERGDSITLSDGIGIDCVTELGPYYCESTYLMEDLAIEEAKCIPSVTIICRAHDLEVDTGDLKLPVSSGINVALNSDQAIEELSYKNNHPVHPVMVTAPDLAVKIVAPRFTTSVNETAIGIQATNLGEVESNETILHHSITGEPEAVSSIPALMPGESTFVWLNQTLAAGEYTVSAEVNRAGATDCETTLENNLDYTLISSHVNPVTRIELSKDVVLVPGTTYDLPITVSGVSDLAAYQIDLAFNGSILEVEDILPGSLGIMAKNIRAGSVSFNGAALSGVSGDVTIATIRFNATGTTGDETILDLAAGLWDMSTLPIPVETMSGSVHLLLYGDASGDGRVDQADTLCVLKWIVGLEDKPDIGTPGFLAADVNQNRVIDVGDAMFIAQYNVGLRDVWFELIE